jgi:uncharacterized protein YkwD
MKRIILLHSALAFFIVGVISCGGSSGGGSKPPTSLASSSQASVTSLATPQNVTVMLSDNSIRINWSSVSGATGYRIYYATEANLLISNITSFDDGMRLEVVNPPQDISGLRSGETYYFVVTAFNETQESAASSEVSATPGAADITREPTAQEVLVVELVNRARANPGAEAARFGIGLNEGISGPQIIDTPKAPLAHNLLLIDSARRHSKWMLDADIFSHTGVNNSEPHQRMESAGYQFVGNWASGENIAWGGTTGSRIDSTAYAISQHEGLFKSPGHRVNILSENYREIGVGQKEGYFFREGRNFLSSMLTQNFARSGANYFLTGVVYNDKNANEFYDVGEGLGNIAITINGKAYPVYSTGAYSIPLNRGSYEISISGDVLGEPAYYVVQINNQNRKLDLIKTGDRVVVVAP